MQIKKILKLEMDIRLIRSFLINLDSQPHKFATCTSQLTKIGIHPERFPAVMGSEVGKEALKNILHPHAHHTLNRGRYTDGDIGSYGAVGCYLSHVRLWQKLLDSHDEMFLIFEDDAEPSMSLAEINHFTTSLADGGNWDVILLGWGKPLAAYFGKDQDLHLENTAGLAEKIMIRDVTFFTHSYIINRRGARLLLQQAFPIFNQIDAYISSLAMCGVLNVIRSSKQQFHQNLKSSMFSTIQEGPIYGFRPIVNGFSSRTIIIYFLVATILAIYGIYNIVVGAAPRS